MPITAAAGHYGRQNHQIPAVQEAHIEDASQEYAGDQGEHAQCDETTATIRPLQRYRSRPGIVVETNDTASGVECVWP